MCLCLGVLRWIVTSFNREREREREREVWWCGNSRIGLASLIFALIYNTQFF